MKKISTHDLEYYISLIVILALGLLFVLLASPNKVLQFILIILTTSFYIVFGVVHHVMNHDISRGIMLEYLIIGALGISILFFFLKGGLFL
ncbi:MAG: hypothetical protein AAB521_03675 [Patescibacteria group bacterium]